MLRIVLSFLMSTMIVGCSDELNGLSDYKVENVVITNVSDTTIGLKWSKINGAKEYGISAMDSMGHQVSKYCIHNIRDTSILLEGMTPNTKYGFVVAAAPIIDGPGSQPSDVIWQRTLP